MLRTVLFLGVLMLPVLAGCGSAKQQYENEAWENKAPNELLSLSSILVSLSKTGTMNSGTIAVGDYIEKLKDSPGFKYDEIKKDYEDLRKASGNPGKVRSLASQMLSKLPQDQLQTPAAEAK